MPLRSRFVLGLMSASVVLSPSVTSAQSILGDVQRNIEEKVENTRTDLGLDEQSNAAKNPDANENLGFKKSYQGAQITLQLSDAVNVRIDPASSTGDKAFLGRNTWLAGVAKEDCPRGGRTPLVKLKVAGKEYDLVAFGWRHVCLMGLENPAKGINHALETANEVQVRIIAPSLREKYPDWHAVQRDD